MSWNGVSIERRDSPFSTEFECHHVLLKEFGFQTFTSLCCLVHRNQLVDFHKKSTDWFLYNWKNCEVKKVEGV